MKKPLIILIIIALISSFYYLGADQYISLSYIQSQLGNLQNYYQQNPVHVFSIFFVCYVAMVALSIPGALLASLLAGALFGTLVGTLLVSFASSIGALLAFLVARFLFRDWVSNRYQKWFQTVNKGIQKEGAFYLFTLRLVPVVPFFAINLLMALTNMKARTFYWVSQVGMFLGTIVFVNIGTQLATLTSLKGLLAPQFLLAFILIGIMPITAKKIIEKIKANKIYKPYKKPSKFDRNLVVIGGGAAGLVSSYIAASIKAKVSLIEKHKMGGDCLNTGCVPSKAIIHQANERYLAEQQYGKDNLPAINFTNIMQQVHKVISKIEPHDSVERYTNLGVDCITGEATIIDPYRVKVNGQTLTTKNIIIATGARPFVPPIKGLDSINYLTSDTLWQITKQPKRLLILGGGPIGCELAQSFSRLGCQVIQVEMAPRLMIREDKIVSAFIKKQFIAEGIDVKTGHKAVEFIKNKTDQSLICDFENQTVTINFDQVLIAVGRAANVSGFGLSKLGINLTEQNTVEVNENLQTNYPNIYACGDVAGPYQFTHMAAHQAWYSSVNSLFAGFKSFKVDYSIVPWATFTAPEVARVGLNETDAKQQNIAYELTQYGIDDLDRAITDSQDEGFIRVLTVPGKDKILGVTIVGHHASDIISEWVLAMKHGLGLKKIMGTIHIYPTHSEANKYLAGNWMKNHKPEKALVWLEKFHTWRRG